MRRNCYPLLILVVYCVSLHKAQSTFPWDIRNCGHNEISFNPEKSVYLDAKIPFLPLKFDSFQHCIAVLDEDKGEFRNYEMKAEILSLESTEGTNSGNNGIIFNYMDAANYDFVYLQYVQL